MYKCMICRCELFTYDEKIVIALDGELHEVCMVCKNKINTYVKATGKKITCPWLAMKGDSK